MSDMFWWILSWGRTTFAYSKWTWNYGDSRDKSFRNTWSWMWCSRKWRLSCVLILTILMIWLVSFRYFRLSNSHLFVSLMPNPSASSKMIWPLYFRFQSLGYFEWLFYFMNEKAHISTHSIRELKFQVLKLTFLLKIENSLDFFVLKCVLSDLTG